MQTEAPFSAQTKVKVFSATTGAPTAEALQNTGNTLRVVNEGPNVVFIAVGDTAATAVATLPANGSVTSCYVGIGADVTFSIPNDSIKYVSGICRTGTAVLNFYVNESS